MKPRPPDTGDMYVHCGHNTGLSFHWIGLPEGTMFEDPEGTQIWPKWLCMCLACYTNFAESPEDCDIAFASILMETPIIQRAN